MQNRTQRYDRILDIIVKICRNDKPEEPEPLGTGFFVHSEGYILTCFHVIEPTIVSVEQSNICAYVGGVPLVVEVCECFPEKDIAILKTESNPNISAPLEGSWTLDDKVYMFGFQDNENFNGMSLVGKIAGPAYMGEAPDVRMLIKICGIDIRQGMSGSPVFNVTNGKVIGLITSAYTEREVGFAIPIDDVFSVWNWLRDEYERLRDDKEFFRRKVVYTYKLLNHKVEQNVPIGPSYKADIILTTKLPGLPTTVRTMVQCTHTSSHYVQVGVVNDTDTIGLIAKQEGKAEYVAIVSNKEYAVEAKRVAAQAGIQLLTLKDIENALIDFDSYIDELIMKYEQDELCSCYMDLKIKDDQQRNYSEIPLSKIIDKEWSLRESQKHSFIILTGEYGTGKTSFCQKIARDFARNYKDNPGEYRIPILFNLKPYRKALDINQVTTTALVRDCDVSLNDDKLFEKMNAGGSFVLIFDGFNEMALKLTPEEAAQNFKQLSMTFAKSTKVIITCREEYLEIFKQVKNRITRQELGAFDWEPEFKILYLQELDNNTIESYLRRRNTKDWKNYWDIIRNNDFLNDLVRRPIFLEMISRVKVEIEGEFAKGRGKQISMGLLMDYYTKEILSKWSGNGTDSENLTTEEKALLLSKIGYFMIQKGQTTVGYFEIKEIVQSELSALNRILSEQFADGNVKRTASNIDSYCKDLLLNSVLKGRFGKGKEEMKHYRYEFSHSCFLYYFSAKRLLTAIRDNEPDVFDILFIGAETLLLLKDFLMPDKRNFHDRICKWLDVPYFNIQKYAILLLAFVGTDQCAKRIKTTIEDMYGPLGSLRMPKRVFETTKDHIEHLKQHAQLALSQLGSREFEREVIKTLLEDPDYTHTWYALLGVEQICSRNDSCLLEFRVALLRTIDDRNKKPELQRLASKILLKYGRQYERFSVRKKVHLDRAGECSEADLMNISKGGALIRAGQIEIISDEPAQLVITEGIKILATIVDRNEDSIHLKFQSDDNEWDRIKALFPTTSLN